MCVNPYHYERVVSPGIDLSGLSIQVANLNAQSFLHYSKWTYCRKIFLQQNYGLGKQDEDWRGLQQGMDVDRDQQGQGTVAHHPGWPAGPPPGARPVPCPPGIHPPQPPQVEQLVAFKTLQIQTCRLCPTLPPPPPHCRCRLHLTVKTEEERTMADRPSLLNRWYSPHLCVEEPHILFCRLVPQSPIQRGTAGWELMAR